MKKFTPALFAASLVLGLCAPATLAQDKPEARAAAPAPARTTVRLIDAGAEPRHPLRYTPTVGAMERITMSTKTLLKQEIDGQAMPSKPASTSAIVFDMNIVEVRPNGDVKYHADFGKTGDVDLTGMTGDCVVTNRGETKESNFKAAESASPMIKAAVDAMKTSVGDVSSPLPEEAVGKGAKWEVKMKVQSSGMVIDQTMIVTLIDITGDSYTQSIEMTQSAAPQKVRLPNAPMDVEIVKIDSTGKGTMKGSTRMLAPSHSELSLKSSQEMKVARGDQDMVIKQDLVVDVTLTGEENPAKPEKKAEPDKK